MAAVCIKCGKRPMAKSRFEFMNGDLEPEVLDEMRRLLGVEKDSEYRVCPTCCWWARLVARVNLKKGVQK